jgi:hypothetical protein
MSLDHKNTKTYDDIIDLPRPISSHRKPMSQSDRAAQFSPFAALTGFEGAIKESARLTDKRIELDENEKSILDEKLRNIQEQLGTHQEIEILFFQPDEMKVGGKFISERGLVKKIDAYERIVVMQNGTKIPIDDIAEIIEL